jgi:hypothetical protein
MPIKVAQTEWDEWNEWDKCDRIKANQGKSSQIKANQACGGGGWGDNGTGAKRSKNAEVIVVVLLIRVFVAMALPGENQAGSRLIKVNQTKSNQIKPAGVSLPRFDGHCDKTVGK